MSGGKWLVRETMFFVTQSWSILWNWDMTIYYLRKCKMANNQLSWTNGLMHLLIRHLRYFLLGNTFDKFLSLVLLIFTLRSREKGQFDKKQEEFVFEVISGKANTTCKMFSEKSAFVRRNYYSQAQLIVKNLANIIILLFMGFTIFKGWVLLELRHYRDLYFLYTHV